MACLIELFNLPLKASFNLIFKSGTELYLIHLCPLFVFLLEIILNFNTGYYQDGVIVKQRKKIINNYIREMFWVDLINASTIALVYYITPEWLYIFFWFLVIQLNATYKIIDEHYQITYRYPSLWTLLKLLTQILFVAHFVGCCFHSVG